MSPLPDSSAPPTLQAAAARRWQLQMFAKPQAPWLHTEVASRMLERLDLLRLSAGPKLVWQPELCGPDALSAFRSRYGADQTRTISAAVPNSAKNLQDVHEFKSFDAIKQEAKSSLARNGLLRRTWASWFSRSGAGEPAKPDHKGLSGLYPFTPEQAQAAGNAQLVWSNLLLHGCDSPQALIQRWHQSLAVGGCAMFSALGVDTGIELARVHARLGWGPSAAQLTDMHDFGDMLVANGFADPVMDMEHLTLTYSDADALLADWRSFGRNAHVQRFGGLRGKSWLAAYKRALNAQLRRADGSLAVTVELIYGHAFKPEPRLQLSGESAISMREMRQMLSRRRAGPAMAPPASLPG